MPPAPIVPCLAQQLLRRLRPGPKHVLALLPEPHAEDLRLPKLSEGFAVQVRVLPSESQVLLDARLAWTQVLCVDDVTSEARVLHFPRVAEATLQELRLLALGKVAVLGRMGPLPAEAGTLPNLTVQVRVSKSQP